MDLEKLPYIQEYGNYKEKVLNINIHAIKYETNVIL